MEGTLYAFLVNDIDNSAFLYLFHAGAAVKKVTLLLHEQFQELFLQITMRANHFSP
jgi:hypothetical protein